MDDKIESKIETEESTAEKHTDILSQTKISVMAICGIALLIVILIVSVVLNVMLLTKPERSNSLIVFHWIVVGGSMLIACFGLGMSFWMYYARTIYLKNGPALVPERWGRIIIKLGNAIKKANKHSDETFNTILKTCKSQTEKSEVLLESFLTLQQAISYRDEEIYRLKKGYDAKIFKHFVARFIRVSVALEEIREQAKNSEQIKNYNYLCKLVQNALEDCGVTQVHPPVGYDYREAGQEIAEDPNIVITENPLLDFQIASVESPAFVIEGEGDREIIIQAKVSIYKFSENKGVVNG